MRSLSMQRQAGDLFLLIHAMSISTSALAVALFVRHRVRYKSGSSDDIARDMHGTHTLAALWRTGNARGELRGHGLVNRTDSGCCSPNGHAAYCW